MKIEADSQLETMIALARTAASRALELHREHQDSGIEVELKGPHDPVSRADRELNALICGELRAAFPAAAVIGEESAPRGDELVAALKTRQVFFVDPIDGTREFVAGSGEFAVMIGLAVAGRAAAGVVAVPVEEVILAGRVGQRAFAERGQERAFVTVSETNEFAAASMVVSRSHRPAFVDPLRRRLGIGSITPCASVGVKVARLVTGAGDIYVHRGHGLKRWDTCAPEAVLAAAGGRCSDLEGRPIDYAERVLSLRRGLVATNGVLHPGVLSACGWAAREADRVST